MNGPTVLIASTSRWLAPARLARALADSGCDVEAVCPDGGPLSRTAATSRLHSYGALSPTGSFRRAIRSACPDLIVPCDDLATEQLHRLYEGREDRGGDGARLQELLRASLGPPDVYPLTESRAQFMALAKEEDIRVPETALVSSMGELRTWLGQHGFPALLKTDGSAGGRGVRVVTCMDDAERAFRFLGSPPSLARTAKRAIVDRDRTWIRSYLLRRRPALIVQEFVAGHEATCTVACWEGQIRAIIVAEVLRNWESRGPASVVRLVQNEAILSAAAKIVLRLRMSNLCGFDFVIEGRTGQPYLIEMNARATQTAHLALGPGRDLPAAIHAAIAGTPVRERDRVTNNDVIALFPLEWQRDPASKFLQCGYHDVPWDETRLVREALRPRWTFREYRQPSPAEHSVPLRAKLP